MAQPDALGADSRALATALKPPHGLEQIMMTFGELYNYVRKDGSLDPRWQGDFLRRVALPFPLAIAWDQETSITQMTCHTRLTEVFTDVFATIQSQGLQPKLQTFGGCFAFRPQRTGSKLSAHAWGIAIDLNPGSNAQGSAGEMDSGVVEIFREAGFTWGGEREGPKRDPMHFQYCTGY
jgi:hypothetical protein